MIMMSKIAKLGYPFYTAIETRIESKNEQLATKNPDRIFKRIYRGERSTFHLKYTQDGPITTVVSNKRSRLIIDTKINQIEYEKLCNKNLKVFRFQQLNRDS